MTPIDFLKAVWPSQGFYCIATPFVPPNETKPVWAHKVFADINDASQHIEKNKDTKDLYFAIHSLKEEKVWNPKKINRRTGETGAYEIRVQTNMCAAKCFFFDLDVGDAAHKYASQEEAFTDLKQFCKAMKLPKPLVVSSGGGLHVYWLLTEELPSQDWREHANKLHQLAKHFGLRADPARTTDTASVLRIAGTYNHKRGLKRVVQVLTPDAKHSETEQFLNLLNQAVIREDVDVRPVYVPRPMDDDEGNIRKGLNMDPVSLKALLSSCQLMGQALLKKGNVSEPEWYNAIGVLRFVHNGRSIIHKWSSGYEGYDPAATDAKIAQSESRQTGPTTCAKLEEVFGSSACEGCPLRGKITSPTVRAKFEDKAETPKIEIAAGPQTIHVDIPEVPFPYSRLKTGEISVATKNKDGDTVNQVILGYDLYPIRRMVNSLARTEQQVWRVTLPRKGIQDFILDSDALYDRKKFVVSMANNGIYAKPKNIDLLQDYMIAYISKLQQEMDEESQYNHLGWTDDMSSFILPEKIILPDGTAKAITVSNDVADASDSIKKKGTLERQVELIDFYNQRTYAPQQFMILCGLAAPIFYMTGHHGVVVNASGDSGASKSTSLYTAASFWGQPELYTIDGTTGATSSKGLAKRIATWANLPVCVDEITHMPPYEAKNLVMRITQPSTGIVLTRGGKERSKPDGYKATIMLSTANSSLHNLISIDNAAGNAGSMRVFEMVFKDMGTHSKQQADDYLHELKQNYGWIGEVFMAHVVRNSSAVAYRIRQKIKEVDAKFSIKSSERFWSSVVACVIVTGEIANELGLIGFDMDNMLRWLSARQIPMMRSVVTESYNTPAGTLADFFEIYNNNILVVSKATGYGDNIPNILRDPHGQLVGHYDVSTKRMWVSRKAFKDWCVKGGVNYNRLTLELEEPTYDANGQASRVITSKAVRKVLGAGTPYAKAQSWCIEVNMAHPELSGLAELTVVSNKPVVNMPTTKTGAD